MLSNLSESPLAVTIVCACYLAIGSLSPTAVPLEGGPREVEIAWEKVRMLLQCKQQAASGLRRAGVELRCAAGMTETSPIGTVGALKSAVLRMPGAQQKLVLQKQGRPHVLMGMRIVDDQGRPLLHDGKTSGNLQVRGPHVVKEYFKVGTCGTPLRSGGDKTMHGWRSRQDRREEGEAALC